MELAIAVLLLTLAPMAIFGVGEKERKPDYADAMDLYSRTNTLEGQAKTTNDAFLEFVHQKMNQHSEALEKILQKMDTHEKLTKNISELLSDYNKLENPDTHGKIKIYHGSRRSNTAPTKDEEMPLINLGKKIIKYGTVLKSAIMTDITKDTIAEDMLETGGDEIPTTIKK